MYLNRKSDYISGITKMASCNLAPSYMDASCYENDNYIESFFKSLRLPKQKIELEEENIPWNKWIEVHVNIKGYQLETFAFLIEREAGLCKKLLKYI